MTYSKEDVIGFLANTRIELKKMGVKRIGLFGSLTRNTQHQGSDIDLLVEFNPKKKSFDHFMEVFFLMEDNFQCGIDLVTKESLSPYIGPHILKEVEYVTI